MKKIILIILSLVMLLSMTSITLASENYEKLNWNIHIENENVELQSKGIIKIGEAIYLPLNQICAILGYDIAEKANTITVTEGENCKNTKGTVKSVQFEIGTNKITSETKSHTLNIQEEMNVDYLTTKIGEEIYMSALHFGRAFDLYLPKLAYGNNNLSILTRNYCEEYHINMPGVITVTNKTADGSLRIAVNDKVIDFKTKPFIDENGRTQMPVREFCEFLDKKVMWLEETQTVSVSSVSATSANSQGGGAGGASYWFTIGEKRYRLNGTYFEMDTAAQIIDEKTFVPLRYLAEMMNYTVQYNPVTVSAEKADYIEEFTDNDKAGNVKQFEKITVGINAELPPFEYYDENGELTGFDIDLMNYIAERIGFEIEYVNMSFDKLIPAVVNGEVDCAVSAITVTEERDSIIDYSRDYLMTNVITFEDGQKSVKRGEYYAIVFREGLSGSPYKDITAPTDDEALYIAIDTALSDLSQDRTVEKLIEKYELNKPLDEKAEFNIQYQDIRVHGSPAAKDVILSVIKIVA